MRACLMHKSEGDIPLRSPTSACVAPRPAVPQSVCIVGALNCRVMICHAQPPWQNTSTEPDGSQASCQRGSALLECHECVGVAGVPSFSRLQGRAEGGRWAREHEETTSLKGRTLSAVSRESSCGAGWILVTFAPSSTTAWPPFCMARSQSSLACQDPPPP